MEVKEDRQPVLPKTYYFGYRLRCGLDIKDGKVQAKAHLLNVAIADSLEQLRGYIQ